jgi:NAD dependent epimerase/dehydratase family enzyme
MSVFFWHVGLSSAIISRRIKKETKKKKTSKQTNKHSNARADSTDAPRNAIGRELGARRWVQQRIAQSRTIP